MFEGKNRPHFRSFTIGAIFSVGGQFILHSIPWLNLIIGVGLTALGIWTGMGRTLLLPLPTIAVKGFGRSPQAMFLYGIAYGLASLGCALPVFLSVVAGALATVSLLFMPTIMLTQSSAA